MSSSTPTSIQPGWYEDPQAAGMLRWFDGVTWSPFTKPHAAVARPAAVPQPRVAASGVSADAQVPGHSVAAARAALLAAESGPIPVVPTAPVAQPLPAAGHPEPAATQRATATITRTVTPPAQVPAPRRPAAPAPTWPVTQGPPASSVTQSVAAARAAVQAPPARPASTADPAPSVTTPATDWLAATVASAATAWPATAAAPTPAPTTSSAWVPAEDAAPEPTTVRGPTSLRRLVGGLAEDLPAWLPAPIAERLSLRMVRYATRTDRFRDRLTAEGLKRLVFPEETAWQASVAACLGVLTIALSVWPVAGFGAWLVTGAFAGLALRRLRREVLLGGAERAWFALACGVGPLWTGLLALLFR